MHIFLAIVAAGITLYLLRNWWERLQVQRTVRHMQRLLNPPPEPEPCSDAVTALRLIGYLAVLTSPLWLLPLLFH